MRFCCVTPCYNAERHIEHTVRSVLSQDLLRNESYHLHYIIKDGGSNDSTVEKILAIIAEYADRPNIYVELITEKDNGMYDALAASFAKMPPGDIYSYLNAGDYYSSFAFEIVAEIFTKYNIHFLTGLSCVYNEKNHLLSCCLPYRYDRQLLQTGYYGTILPHVQQESTFWSNKLHKTIQLDVLRTTRLAGDYFLWKNFIRLEPLYIVAAQLGGFKIHKGQLSENEEEYKKEMKNIAQPGSIWLSLKAFIYKACWHLPNMLKKRLSKQIIGYDHKNSTYSFNA